jgi:hypothetical protein
MTAKNMPKKQIAHMSAAGSKSGLKHMIRSASNDSNDGDDREVAGKGSGGDGEEELSEGERELLEREAKGTKKGKGKGRAKGKDDDNEIGEDTKRKVRVDSCVSNRD